MFKTRYYDPESIEGLLTLTYACGKSRLFQMFFGWRETYAYGEDKQESRIVLTKHDWEQIDNEIEYYYKYVKKNT